MKRKSTQWWSTIPPISTKQWIISHLSPPLSEHIKSPRHMTWEIQVQWCGANSFFVLSIGRQHCSTISCKDYKWFQLTSIKSFQRQYFPTYLLFCNRCASWGTNKTHNTPLEHDPWRMQHLMHVKTTFIISYKQLCMQWVLVTRPESMTTWPYAFDPRWSCDTLKLPLTVPPY